MMAANAAGRTLVFIFESCNCFLISVTLFILKSCNRFSISVTFVVAAVVAMFGLGHHAQPVVADSGRHVGVEATGHGSVSGNSRQHAPHTT